MSINNSCTFVGRVSSDHQVETVQSQTPFTKTKFSIASARSLSKAQRQAKQSGQDVKTADFISCEATGAVADLLVQYFPKGTPITIRARYEEYSYTDKQNQKKYGHKFIVEEVGFVPQPSQNAQQQGGAQQQNNNGYQQQPQQNYQQNNQQNQYVNNNMNNNGQFVAPDGDIPF